MAVNKSEKESLADEFINSVNVTGLNYVVKKNIGIFRKLVWFVILTGALLWTSYNIYTQISKYLNRPLVVTIDKKSSPNIAFPTVTVCSYGTFNSQRMACFVLSDQQPDEDCFDFRELARAIIEADVDTFNAIKGSDTDLIQYIFSSVNLVEMIKRAALRLDELIIKVNVRISIKYRSDYQTKIGHASSFSEYTQYFEYRSLPITFAFPFETLSLLWFGYMAVNKSEKGCLADEFINSVTVTGLNYVVKRNVGMFRKFVWFILLTGALIWTGYNIYTQIAKYLNKPLFVTIDKKSSPNIAFPTVTVCSYGTFNSQRMACFVLGDQQTDKYCFDFREVARAMIEADADTFSAIMANNTDLIQYILSSVDLVEITRQSMTVGR